MSSMFELAGGGLGVMPDPNYNPDNHVVSIHDRGTRISFVTLNVTGNTTSSVEIDDIFFTDWRSQLLDPVGKEVGFSSPSRLPKGEHSVLLFANPGSGKSDHASNALGAA